MFIREGQFALSEARRLARALVLQCAREFPVDIVRMACMMGYTVEYADIQWSGYIPENENRIIVRRADLPARQRFTIGHEIGHILLQLTTGCSMDECARLGTTQYDLEEDIADTLAADMLMPAREFKAELRKYEQPSIYAIKRIARVFGVSFTACMRRITEIPGFVGFSHLYEVQEDMFGNTHISWKEGYPTHMELGFVVPPLEIVKNCLMEASKNGKPWAKTITVRRGLAQIKVPSVGSVFMKNCKTRVRLLGWKLADNAPGITKGPLLFTADPG